MVDFRFHFLENAYERAVLECKDLVRRAEAAVRVDEASVPSNRNVEHVISHVRPVRVCGVLEVRNLNFRGGVCLSHDFSRFNSVVG